MDELQKFLFEGLPVRGMLVRLDGSWQESLRRRSAAHGGSGAFAPEVRDLLGEMAAASVLMQANIKFNGALILQLHGDGPVKLAVAEVQPDLSFRVTASMGADGGADVGADQSGDESAELGALRSTDPARSGLADLVNRHGKGRCAVTLDPHQRLPGQQPYQGVVPLHGDQREPLTKLSQVLEHYMLQSEQLDTRMILAADDKLATGLLIQRMPVEGLGNLGQGLVSSRNEDEIGINEAFNRIALLAATLTPAELLTLDTATVLHRLFWEEPLRLFEPLTPRFACRCSRERVRNMLRGLGQPEVDSILEERGGVEIGCEFCGHLYQFDPVDAREIFVPPVNHPPGSPGLN